VQEKHCDFGNSKHVLFINNIPAYFILILVVCMAHLHKDVLHLH